MEYLNIEIKPTAWKTLGHTSSLVYTKCTEIVSGLTFLQIKVLFYNQVEFHFEKAYTCI